MKMETIVATEPKKFNRLDAESLKDAFLLEKDAFIAKYMAEYPKANKGLLTIAYNKNLELLSNYSETQLAELLGTKIEESTINVDEVVSIDLSDTKSSALADFLNGTEDDSDVAAMEVIAPSKVKLQSRRGHYKDLELKYKPGQIVAFKVANEDRIVSGTVEKSYFRKNSKPTGIPIYEQVSVLHNNVIYYKTAQVLDKYNGSN